MDREKAIEHIYVHIAKKYRGNKTAFSRDNGISAQYLSLVLLGKRPISEKIAQAAGLCIVTTVEYMELGND